MISTKIRKLIIIFFISSNFSVYGTSEFAIKNVCFSGLRRIKISNLYANLKTINEKNIFDKKNIGIIIRNLFSTGNFENIFAIRNKNYLIFHVKERPIISNVSLSNSTKIQESFIKENLEKYNIKNGYALNYSKIYSFKRVFETFYQNVGRYNAEIKINISKIDDDHVNIKIYFFDGIIAKIKKINIVGNQSFTNERLISCFIKKEFFTWKKNFDLEYSRFKLINNLNKLRIFYLNKGYINFKINYVNTSLTSDKKNIYITINIHEGEKYSISEKIIDGKLYEFHKKICMILKFIKIGEIYNKEKISILEKKIRKFLDHYGYTYPKILFYLHSNDETKTIKLHVKINIGQKFYVRKLIFKGNKITKTEILKKAIKQLEGRKLEVNLINQGKDTLNKLGLFKFVNFKIKHVPEFKNQVDIIYNVVEDYSKHIKFSVGLEEKKFFGFQIAAIQNNILGTGKTIGLFSRKNVHQFCSEGYVINPIFLKSGTSTKSKIFYKKIYDNENGFYNSGSERYGMESVFSTLVKENYILNFGLNFIHNNLYSTNQLEYLRNIKDSHKKDLSVSFNLQINKTCGQYFPTYGSYSDLFIKFAVPISDNRYYKFSINNSYYLPINENKDWIIMNMINLGYVNNFKNYFIPSYDFFYSEEENIIRGFNPAFFGPKLSFIENKKCKLENQCCKIKKYPIGGNSILMDRIELIFPIPFLNKEYRSHIRTSLFLDFGNIWKKNWNKFSSYYKNLNSIRISSGISIQWISPIGPLVFSYSEPIKKSNGDKIEKFQFSFGKIW